MTSFSLQKSLTLVSPWSLKFTKDLGFKAKDLGIKAKAKDLEFKAKDLGIKAKDLEFKAMDLRISPYYFYINIADK